MPKTREREGERERERERACRYENPKMTVQDVYHVQVTRKRLGKGRYLLLTGRPK